MPTRRCWCVAVAVVGGLASITGAVLGAVFVVGLPALFPNSTQVGLLTSGAGLLILLLYFPGGLVQILYNVRDVVLAAVANRRPAPPPGPAPDRRFPSALPSRPVTTSAEAAPALRTDGVSVRFGSAVGASVTCRSTSNGARSSA